MVENHEHNMVIAKQYEPFVIPCKPTSPKVKVELINENSEVKEISFNETIGFHVVSTEAMEANFIFCKFYLNNRTEEIDNIFEVDCRFSF